MTVRFEAMKKQNRFPAGWNEARVQRVLAHYERQSDTGAVAEDEAAYTCCCRALTAAFTEKANH
jgi:hypothetical protein